METLSEREKAVLLDSISELVVYHDKDRRIRGVNKTALDLWGVEPEQVRGRFCYEILGSRCNNCSNCLAGETLKSGKAEQSEITTADGRIWLARSSPVTDEEGEVVGCVNVLRDITERKRERDALHRLVRETSSVTGTEFFGLLAEQLAEWLNVRWVIISEMLAEEPGRVRPLAFWNKNELAHLGPYYLEGTPCQAVVSEGYIAVTRNIQTLFPNDADLVKMGAESYVGIALLDSEQNPLGLICVLHDEPIKVPSNIMDVMSIFAQRAGTELLRMRLEKDLIKAKESAEAANKTKTEFLATVSHELLTPLNAIIGFSDILSSDNVGPLNERQRRYIRNIQSGGKRLHELIRDLLDLAMSEMKLQPVVYSVFSVKDAIENVIAVLSEGAKEKGLIVDLDAPEGFPLLKADRTKFEKVLLNLIGNAIKFTPEEGTVDVENRLEAVGGKPVFQISVRDSGIGISPEDQPNIFALFTQADSSYSREYPGLGSGLTLARNYVEMAGGNLTVESEGQGKGSVFIFTIPLEPPE